MFAFHTIQNMAVHSGGNFDTYPWFGANTDALFITRDSELTRAYFENYYQFSSRYLLGNLENGDLSSTDYKVQQNIQGTQMHQGSVFYDGEFYIGSANDFKMREYNHLPELLEDNDNSFTINTYQYNGFITDKYVAEWDVDKLMIDNVTLFGSRVKEVVVPLNISYSWNENIGPNLVAC